MAGIFSRSRSDLFLEFRLAIYAILSGYASYPFSCVTLVFDVCGGTQLAGLEPNSLRNGNRRIGLAWYSQPADNVRMTWKTGASSYAHLLPGDLFRRFAKKRATVLYSCLRNYGTSISSLWEARLPQCSLSTIFGRFSGSINTRAIRIFGQVLHFITDALLKALRDYPYAPVIVDISPESRLSPHSDPHILEFLRQDPRVVEAFKPYALARTVDYCRLDFMSSCRFEIWRRNERNGAGEEDRTLDIHLARWRSTAELRPLIGLNRAQTASNGGSI